LPAFNRNTKPLKSRALDQLLRALKLCLMRALGHGAIFNASVSGSTDNPGRSADGAFKGGEISGAGTAVARWPRTGLKA
jgi:hypothetical protein